MVLINFENFIKTINNTISTNNLKIHQFSNNKFNPTNTFYNFFYLFSDNKEVLNQK